MSTTVKRSTRPLLLGAAAVAAILVALVAFFFLGDAPEEVSISDAVDAAQPATGDDAQQDAAEVDPEGTWTVDDAAVPYSFDDSTGTFLGFRIDEELANVGNATAVGRSPVVTGSLTLEGSVLTQATFSGDLSQLSTNESRRDNPTRKALLTSQFPLTTFTLTEPIDLGSVPAVSQEITVDAVGDLTVASTTRTVTIPLQASLSASGLLVVTASFDVALDDYAIDKPQSNAVLSIEDVATVEVQLYLTKD